MPTLQEQAIRLRRTKWSNAWMLADELYLMIMSMDVPNTGNVNVNLPSGGGDPFVIGPFPDLNIPKLDLLFPDPFTTGQGDDRNPQGDGPTTGVETTVQRLMVPGQVTSAGTSSSTVRIYPNGQITLPGADTVATQSVTAKHLDSSVPVKAGQWVSIYRVVVVEIIKTLIQQNGIQTTVDTKVNELSSAHYLMPPASGKSVFPGTVQSGSGSLYTVRIFTDGISGGGKDVSVNQLQITPSAAIPVGTAALVLEVTKPTADANGNETGGVYAMQVPVWLEG